MADVIAHIGKSVMIKGELSGSEDLYVDGQERPLHGQDPEPLVHQNIAATGVAPSLLPTCILYAVAGLPLTPACTPTGP